MFLTHLTLRGIVISDKLFFQNVPAHGTKRISEKYIMLTLESGSIFDTFGQYVCLARSLTH